MEEEIKIKKERKKKEIPLFSHINYKGAIKELNGGNVFKTCPDIPATALGGLLLSPYSEFIPLSYLLFSNQVYGDVSASRKRISEIVYSAIPMDITEKKLYERLQKMPNLFTNLFYNAYNVSPVPSHRQVIVSRLKEIILNFCLFDKPYYIPSALSQLNMTDLGGSFRQFTLSDQHACSYYENTSPFQGAASFQLVSLLKEGKLLPHIVGVIPKENYLWVKFHYLMTGNIDLSKCLFLIDRGLDSTSFWKKEFRLRYYRDIIIPYLQTLDCEIYKVPLEFIQKNCFISEYKFEAKTIQDRKAESEKLIGEMYSYLQRELLGEHGEIPSPQIVYDGPPQPTWEQQQIEEMREARQTVPGVEGQAFDINWRPTYTIGVDPIGITMSSVGNIYYTGNMSTMSDRPTITTTEGQLPAYREMIQQYIGASENTEGQVQVSGTSDEDNTPF